MSRSRFRFGARLLQLYFIIGLLALAGVWFFFSQFLLIRLSRSWQGYVSTLSAQLENDTQLRSRIYAKFMARATEPSEGSSPELDIIFDEIIRKLDFPVIVTDARGKPTSWRNLPVESPDSVQLAGLMYVLDSEHEPVPLIVTEGDATRKLGEIHYGLSASAVTLRNVNANLVRSVRYLAVFSVLQVLLLVGFVIVGVWGVLVYKRREQEHIWTALAKETAHQMATPLSSFSAWLDVLRERAPDATKEMEQDLIRMKEVLDRFSRIGMPPELTPHQVGPAIERSVAFVRRRAPKTVAFATEIADNAMVLVDDVLFSWMLENLLKNSVDAIGTKPGEVRVRSTLSADKRLLEIEVTDSGEGVKTDRLFEPGVTTKKYGWGVGLTLAKRIAESYHRGKLLLKESQPGRTVFSIFLPVSQGPGKES